MLSSIVPILGVNDRGEPCLVGSGFLVAFDDHYLCVTAAHVTDDMRHGPLYTATESSGFLQMPSDITRTIAPRGGRGCDKIDLAFWEIPVPPADRLQPDRMFLKSQFIRPSASSTEGHVYTFVGYPHKLTTKVYGTNEVRIACESFTGTTVNEVRLRAIGGDTSSHIGIEFSHKKVMGQGRIQTPRDCRGMSGGPVLALTDGAEYRNLPNIRIVGVVVEHHRTHGAVLCTKIDKLLHMVSSRFGLKRVLLSSATLVDEMASPSNHS